MKLLIIITLISFKAQAQVLLRVMGVIGLASHDMFTWDKVTESISEVSFIQHICELFSKGICPLDNPWMPQKVSCP